MSSPQPHLDRAAQVAVPVAEPAAAVPPDEARTASSSRDGLSEVEAARRLAEAPAQTAVSSSRSYASIFRANVLTVFNLILAAFGGLTLVFGDARDALFLGIIVANSSIGIIQETRAKRALDRLSLLVAPRATVRRGGSRQEVPAEGVVIGDIIVLTAGDQLVADAEILSERDLRLDESMLTGESRLVAHKPGDTLLSGSFVVEGTAEARVIAVGQRSFAARITGEARSFRHPRSPLERSVNRLLYALVGLVVILGGVLGFSLVHRHLGLHPAVSTASAGVVTLIPEGLMVLVSLTYAAAAVRMSRRGVLAQQLNAIESLAAVDTICIDKTGTLTGSALRVVELLSVPDITQAHLRECVAAVAAASSTRNITMRALAEAFPGEAQTPRAEVPFSSRRRWSAVELERDSLYLGAPGRVPVGSLAAAVEQRQQEGRRVLALARAGSPVPEDPEDQPPDGLEPLGVVVLAEDLRPNVRETISFLRAQDVEVKVLSGDAPQTVGAIARDVGIPVDVIADGEDVPQLDDPEQLRKFASETDVVGRISPAGKQALVQALREEGRYVAMIGDGVNDVPALKSARLAIAQGSGAQMARSVADLVLISGDFAAVPALVAEGRRALRNLQRVAKLYVTKSAFAAFLILTVGTSTEAYPLLPRHLSLAATLTIGIPTFFLALAPSSGAWETRGFLRSVSRFAAPAGVMIGTGVVASYLFAVHDLNESVANARVVALTTLILSGLYLVLALEAGGSLGRSSLVGTMCGVMAGLYIVALAMPSLREFFALTVPDAGMVLTALVSAAVSIGMLILCGFSLRTAIRN